METRKMLIPLDDSDFSRKILPHVSQFFSPDHWHIILFRAARAPGVVSKPENEGLPPRSVFVGGGLSIPLYEPGASNRSQQISSQSWENFEDTLRDEMGPDLRNLQEAGYNVSLAIHVGEPAQEIVSLALQENVALVAMATHGRTGLARILRGSVAEHVLRHLSIPLLLLRPDKEST
jgi:nucleotide-binding universal stress UspA family protein